MDEIEKRLRETSETCFNCFESWQKNKKSAEAREALIEAIHELRKVSSRLEIELAISERDEMKQNQIPIPPHRDAQRRPAVEHDENIGNRDNGNTGNRDPDIGQHRQQHRRRPPQKRSGP